MTKSSILNRQKLRKQARNLLLDVAQGCLANEHILAHIHRYQSNPLLDSQTNSRVTTKNTCIAGLLGSITRNIQKLPSAHNEPSANCALEQCRSYLINNMRTGVLWNYYPKCTSPKLPNDLDDTVLALYVIQNKKDSQQIFSHITNLLDQQTDDNGRINTWILGKNTLFDSAWFHEDITVLAHSARLLNELSTGKTIVEKRIDTRIVELVKDANTSIFYTSNWWTLYALSEWFPHTETLRTLFESCSKTTNDLTQSAFYLLCYLQLKKRHVNVVMLPDKLEELFIQISTVINTDAYKSSYSIGGIYFEKITSNYKEVAYSKLITQAILAQTLYTFLSLEENQWPTQKVLN